MNKTTIKNNRLTSILILYSIFYLFSSCVNEVRLRDFSRMLFPVLSPSISQQKISKAEYTRD